MSRRDGRLAMAGDGRRMRSQVNRTCGLNQAPAARMGGCVKMDNRAASRKTNETSILATALPSFRRGAQSVRFRSNHSNEAQRFRMYFIELINVTGRDQAGLTAMLTDRLAVRT